MSRRPHPDTFEYEAINQRGGSLQIRLLTLEPRQKSPTICGWLTSVDLHTSKGKFEALSYVCGDETELKTIAVNNRPFKVSTNLFGALAYLRHKSEPRTLWVDAICIHQANETEKGQQVRFMSKIYTNASQVIAFIGPEDHFSRRAFQVVRKLQSAITPVLSLLGAESTNSGQLVQALLRNRGVSMNIFHKTINTLSIAWERLHEEDKDALQRTFLNRAYWSRLWIIQEIMLARHIVLCCGNDELPWAYLERLCLVFRCLHHYFQSSVYLDVRDCFEMENGLVLIRGHFKANQPYIDLIQELLCSCRCGNPKDYVYGMLGVLHLTKSTIYPNYKKSVPGIYLEATRSIIREYGNLDYLCLPKLQVYKKDGSLKALHHMNSTSMRPPEYLSSWTLNWSADFSIPFLAHLEAKGPRLDMDSALSTDQSHFLLLKGVHCSNVTFVSQIFKGSFPTLEDYGRAKKIVRTIPGYNDIDEVCSIIRTLLQDKYIAPQSYKIQQLERNELLLLCSYYVEWIGLDVEETIPHSWKGVIEDLRMNHPIFSSSDCQTFDKIFKPHYFYNLKFIRTSTGGMGLAYGDLQIGDEIWNVHGAKAPFILRPTRASSRPSSLETYEFVGPAWVLDMMEGKVWNDIEAYKESKRLGEPFVSESGFTNQQVAQWVEREFLLA